MSSPSRSFRRVATRVFGVCALVSLLFVVGCTTTATPPPFAVTTTSSQLPAVAVNAAFPMTTLTAANGTAPVTWTETGSLPMGVTLSSAGVLSGTPTASGSFSFMVTAKDSTGKTATANLTLSVNPALASVMLNPSAVIGGTAVTGTVTLTGAAVAAATVMLSSSNAAATVPASVTVTAGSTAANFQVTTSGVNATATATITATDTVVSKTAGLTINPPTVQSVALNPTTVTGGTASTGTVTLTGPAATGGDSVTLMSDNAAAQVSGSVSVLAGQTSATFNVTTTSVNSSTTANIQASFNNSSKSAPLTMLPAPMIASFTAGASTITSGTSTTLTAVFSNGTGSVDNSVGAVTSGVAKTVSPTVTTAYKLTVTNAAGTSVTATATVTVAAAPVITSFTASASTITAGTSTTLTAVFSNGTGNVDNGVGTVTSGTAVTVTPAATTTYTLTVTNTAGTSVTKAVTVTVAPAPAITSFTASPTTINVGQMTSLTATFINGTGSVDNGVGAVTSGTPVSVQPAATTIYTLTVTNAAGTSVTKSVTVTVDTPPVFGTNGCATFSFTVGANGSCNIATTGNPTPSLSLTTGLLPGALVFTDNGNGTAAISGIPNTGTAGSYPLTVTATNSVSSTPLNFALTVVLTAPPLFTSATSASITAGTTGSFTVTASGSPAPSLSVPAGSLPTGVTFHDNGNGTATIAGSATTTAGNSTFTITASNTFAGTTHTVTQSFTLHIVAAPVITSFTAGASTITSGTSTTLTAVFSGGPGSADNGVGTVTSGTAVNVSPASTTTYTLTVTNAAGTSVTKPVTVNVVAAPAITSFTANPTTIVSGNSSTLTPVFSGGTGVITNNVDATSISTSSGTGVMVNPSTTTIYTLKVTNAATTPASVTQTATVTVDSVPAFTSAPSTQFFVGVNGTFSVTTTGNPTPALSVGAGLPATVTFHDNGNGTATISGTPVSGDVGSHPVTITATNSVGSTPQSFTLTVTNAPASVSTDAGLLPPLFAGELFGVPPTNSSVTINITVTNDAVGDALTAALTVDHNTSFNCTLATCGSLGSVVGTAGSGNYTVQYSPPPSTPAFIQTSPTLVVNSSLPGAIGSTDFIEVDPAGILVQVSPPSRGGEVYVGVTPADTRNLTVNIYNDTTQKGVTFAPLTGGGYACGTLSPNQCGTLGTPSAITYSNDPSTGVLTGTLTIPYTAPTTAPAPGSAPSPPYDRPLVDAISVADNTRSGAAPFLLASTPTPGALPPMWIFQRTEFKTALMGISNSIRARILADPGPNFAVNWTLMAGAPPSPCSPACGMLGTPTVTVTGTTVDSTITYTPPATVPTGSNVTPTITAAEADNPSGGDNFTFNILNATCGSGHESVLNGQYAFLMRGAGQGGGHVVFIGSFTADGAGHITSGVYDFNTSGSGEYLNVPFLTAAQGQLPASSYTVGADNRVCFTLTDTIGDEYNFRAGVGTLDGSSHATQGRIVQFTDVEGGTIRVSGILLKQDPTSFAANQFNGTYAFGEQGVESNGNRLTSAGLITSNGAGALSNLSADLDGGGAIATLTGNGTYSLATNAPGGRGTGSTTTTVTPPGSSSTGHFVFYMVSSSHALFMTTDLLSTGQPIQSGELRKQSGAPFAATALDNKDYVFYVEGIHGGDGGNDTVIGQSTFSTGGHAAITLDENKSGAEQATQTPTGVFNIGTNGRTTLSGLPSGANPPVFYLIDSTSAFIVGTGGSAESGFVEQQTPGLSTASFTGSFFFGADAPNTGSQYQSGTVTLNAGNVNGTGDRSGPDGLGIDTISPANGGTYSFSSATVPIGKGTVGSAPNPSIAYAVSPSKIIFMSTGTDVDLFVVQK